MESKHKKLNWASGKLDLEIENSGIRIIVLCIKDCMALLIKLSLWILAPSSSLSLCLQILLMTGHSDLDF